MSTAEQELVAVMKALTQMIAEMQKEKGDGGGTGGGGGGGSGGSGGKGGRVTLHGKQFADIKPFKGGENEWLEWAGDLKILVDTADEEMGEALEVVMKKCKSEKEVLTCREVKDVLVEEAGGVDEVEVRRRYERVEKVAK